MQKIVIIAMVFLVMVTSQEEGGAVLLQKEADPHLYLNLV